MYHLIIHYQTIPFHILILWLVTLVLLTAPTLNILLNLIIPFSQCTGVPLPRGYGHCHLFLHAGHSALAVLVAAPALDPALAFGGAGVACAARHRGECKWLKGWVHFGLQLVKLIAAPALDGDGLVGVQGAGVCHACCEWVQDGGCGEWVWHIVLAIAIVAPALYLVQGFTTRVRPSCFNLDKG